MLSFILLNNLSIALLVIKVIESLTVVQTAHRPLMQCLKSISRKSLIHSNITNHVFIWKLRRFYMTLIIISDHIIGCNTFKHCHCWCTILIYIQDICFPAWNWEVFWDFNPLLKDLVLLHPSLGVSSHFSPDPHWPLSSAFPSNPIIHTTINITNPADKHS